MAAESNEDLKKVYKQGYADGVKTVAHQEAAGQLIERTKAAVEAGEVAAEGIDLADRLAADGNPHKRKIAEALKNALAGSVERMTAPEGAEGRSAVTADPFFSTSASKSLEASESSSDGSTTSSPQPKKRGRPPKHRPHG